MLFWGQEITQVNKRIAYESNSLITLMALLLQHKQAVAEVSPFCFVPNSVSA